ncbi:hypothetical protein SteCoe_32511 [Stentor coeruleus]|uniref:Uncharacterized protein n=1 Tax=Stentor coeruleus TaxID=5963 RepID=A0A1R2AYU6_9CILI|nr:hypothetical protein SteCoe_32511 [Stentor coeruleus]
MSEARLRNLCQSKSHIFSSASPSISQRTREIPQTQSKIFQPSQPEPKNMTYARYQYQKTTISLGNEPTSYREPTKEANFSDMSAAGIRTNQNDSTKYLIGNDRSTFHRKSVNDHLGIPKDFSPKYTKDSAFERKQREFYDGFSPNKDKPIVENNYQEEFTSAKARKMQDRVSVLDTKKYNQEFHDSPKENTRPPLYNPNYRKNETFSSNVFEERVVQEYKKPAETKENDNERRKNHLYSDLFGMEPVNQVPHPTEKLQPASHFLTTSSKPNPNYDPRDQTMKNLSSSIDICDSPNKVPRVRPRTPQNTYQPRFVDSFPSSSQMKQQELATSFSRQNPGKAEVFDLELVSVPNNIPASTIKELCGGVHVVALSLDVDNFTGKSKGTGRLKVRTNENKDISRIERIFKSKGIEIKEHQENVGRKTNYSDISSVNWHNPYEYKRNSTPCGAKETKMKNLESAHFDGQHKWVDRNVESVDGELLAQMQWKHIKTASRPYY